MEQIQTPFWAQRAPGMGPACPSSVTDLPTPLDTPRSCQLWAGCSLPLPRMSGLRLSEPGFFLSFGFYFKHWLSLQQESTRSVLITFFHIIPLLWSSYTIQNDICSVLTMLIQGPLASVLSLFAAPPRDRHDFQYKVGVGDPICGTDMSNVVGH